MKLVLITDQHFGARSNSPIFTKFFEKFYYECFFPYLDKHNIDTVIDLGDTFDKRKNIDFLTLYDSRRMFFDELRSRNIQHHIIVGNHCTYHKNTNDINSIDLLLKEYTNIKVYSEAEDVSFGGIDVLMLPWICSGNYEQSLNKLNETKSEIVFAHLELAGFPMYKGSINEHGMDCGLFRKFDIVASGHFHHRSNNGNIYYLGSPYELTWQDWDDPRGFHVFDTETRELEFINNPFTLFEKFNYDDVNDNPLEYDLEYFSGKFVKINVINKTDPVAFEKFIDRLGKCNPADVKIIEDFSEFLDSDESSIELEDTLTILSDYVDCIDTEIDRGIIKATLKDLYLEALHIEGSV